jgi:hypothetical protein
MEELNRFCDELFAQSRDLYVEEEYDEYDVLIYKPTSLDKVWLSEEGCRQRRIELDQQRQHAHQREQEVV